MKNKLQEIREKHGMSREQLAKHSFVILFKLFGKCTFFSFSHA